MDSNTGHSSSSIRRFSGASKDAGKEWKTWHKWARAFVVVQKARGTSDDALGPLIYTLIDEPALLALESLEIDELNVAGGEELIFSRLAERYPEPEATDRIGEVLDAVFSLRAIRGETTASYTGRARMIFTQAEKEGISVPSVARGYLVLKGMGLTRDQRAVVLAAARKSYEEADINAALRIAYPTVIPEKNAYAVQEEMTEVHGSENKSDEESGEIEALLVDQEDDSPLEEKDAIDILATWKQQRGVISKEKLARGFGPPKPDLQRLKKRVKCFNCGGIGHFSKDCTKPRRNRDARPALPAPKKTGGYFVDVMESGLVLREEEVTVEEMKWRLEKCDFCENRRALCIPCENCAALSCVDHVVWCEEPECRVMLCRPCLRVHDCDAPMLPIMDMLSLENDGESEDVIEIDPEVDPDGDVRVITDLAMDHVEGIFVVEVLSDICSEQDDKIVIVECEDTITGKKIVFFESQNIGMKGIRVIDQEKMDAEDVCSVFVVAEDNVLSEIDELISSYQAQEEAELEEILASWENPECEEADVLVQVATEGQKEMQSIIRQARRERLRRDEEQKSDDSDEETAVPVNFQNAHRVGQAIVDTGCGKTVIGEENLHALRELVEAHGDKVAKIEKFTPTKFKYGNEEVNTSTGLWVIPWKIGSKRLLIRAHSVPGKTPFLLSKPMLKALGAIVDTVSDTLELTAIKEKVRMAEARSGHYVVNIVDEDVAVEDGNEKKDLEEEKELFRKGRTAAQRS